MLTVFICYYCLDRDIGTNGEISYSLTPASSSEPFTIASITGVITLSQTVRYSLSDEWHNYTLVAMDGASGIEQRSTAAELAIRVGKFLIKLIRNCELRLLFCVWML